MTTTAGTSLSASVTEDALSVRRSLSIGLEGLFLELRTTNFSGKRSTIIFPTDVFECVR
jgi:hypothetical protein